MERATARTIEKNVFMVLQYSLLTGRVRLSGDRRDCAADRRFKLNKRSVLRASGMIVGPDKKTINQKRRTSATRLFTLRAFPVPVRFEGRESAREARPTHRVRRQSMRLRTRVESR
jgi:hypothetical protein